MSIKPKKQKKIKKSPKIPAKVVNEDVEMSAEDEDEENEETPLRTDNHQDVSNDEHEDDGNGLAIESPAEDGDDDDDDMDLANFRPGEDQPKKKRKKGIIYISNIPKHMNVTRIREILGEYGKIGRVYLQPEKLPGSDDKKKKKKRKPFARHFTEGWVEFESKRVAKQIVPLLNNKQISSRKKSQFYDYIWSMKYLPRFKWCHLTERMNYEQAVHKQRLMAEVSQARKETTFFQNNLDKSEFIKKKEKKMKKIEDKKTNKVTVA
ncbi:uncharacterized protein LOC101891501 [Musca domestica]|uniref:Activator of basal transcription 1 n=1 Tax=Musca domestica TaxID=7370 RepID=A0A9J7CIY6_MUSDO|nr:uncharacterized protein LOC101891501 [Musca domestica]